MQYLQTFMYVSDNMKSLFNSIFTHYFRYDSLFQDVQLMKTSKQNFNICWKMDDINLSIAATAYDLNIINSSDWQRSRRKVCGGK